MQKIYNLYKSTILYNIKNQTRGKVMKRRKLSKRTKYVENIAD